MNKLEVKPTVENLINMLKQDAIGRNEYIRMFLEMLDNIDDSFSISINGDWGTGKTFFVKQITRLSTFQYKFMFNHIIIKSIL